MELAGSEAVGLANHTTLGTGEALGQRSVSRYFAQDASSGKHALEFGEARREVSRVHAVRIVAGEISVVN